MPIIDPDRPACRIIAVANQKGGVGKTTTAINLSSALCQRGHTVTLIDLDPQGNASTGLGIDRAVRHQGSYALISGATPYRSSLRPTAIPGLSLIPAEAGLAGAEVELVMSDRREFRLRDILAPVSYGNAAPNFIVIDCPPSLNLLSLNALVSAHAVIIPLQAEFLALEGLTQVTATIDRIRKSLNPTLALHGILLTMVDRRNNLSELVEADVRGFFGGKVYQTIIPRNVRLSEAPSHGTPISLYDAKSAGTLAYAQFAEEFLAREMTFATAPGAGT